MAKIFTISFLIICLALLFLLYVNRNSPKIQETIIIITAVIVSACLYVTKPYEIEKSITTLYFVDQKDKENNQIKFFNDEAIIGGFFRDQAFIYYNFIEKLKGQKKDIHFDFHNDPKPLVDLQTIAILEHLLQHYHASWYVEREVLDLPGWVSETRRPRKASEIKKDVKKYSLSDLPVQLKTNRFYREPFDFMGLSVPKNTSFDFSVTSPKETSCEFILRKRYFFNIRIKISYSGGGIGLGKIGHYIGLTKPEEPYSTSDPDFANYFTYILKIRCNAKFHRVTAGNPSTPKYKEWINYMFENLYQKFDWSVCDKAISEHRKDRVLQQILNIKE